MRKVVLLVLFIFFSVFYLNAQTKISGTITDKNKLPLPGASIFVEGTAIGVYSDFDGNFALTVPKDTRRIMVSYLGYVDKKINIGDRTTFAITLLEDSENLDEIIVIGYGTEKKSDLTGAISSIDTEALTVGGAVGLEQGLVGRAAGVVVTQNSGEPGGGASILIRGISSLNGSDPLYVIDGIPIDNTSTTGLGDQDIESSSLSPLSMINPADVESIEILKDASSTAIYGSRGANGVVLITTKRGKEGKGIITVDHEYGVSEVANYINLLDSNQFLLLQSESFVNLGLPEEQASLVQLDSARAGLYPSTDWLREITGLGSTSNTSVSFNGGNEDVRYLISSNLYNAEGIVPDTDFKRISSRINLNANLSEKFKVNTSINYTHVNSNQRAISTGNNNLRGASSAILRALRASPFNGRDTDDTDPGFELWSPLTGLLANRYNNLLTQFIGSMQLEYNFTKALSFKTAFTYQSRNTDQRYYQLNILPNNIAEGGRSRTGDGRVTATTVTNTLNFRKKLGKHNINAVLGQSMESYENETVTTSNYGFANDLLTYYDPGSATFFDPDTVSYLSNNLVSFFGRVNFNLYNKFLFTLTARYDGSSKFAANNKWGLFPAAAVAYKIDKEKFIKDIDAISQLKLRFSYGSSGNQGIQPYQSLDQYASDITAFDEETTAIYYQNQLPSPDLTWETTTQLDAGIDVGFFNNKLTATFDYYNKETTDLLFQGVDIPVQSGQPTKTENYGSLETQGYEFSFNARIFSNDSFSWTLNGNVSTGKTVITDLAGSDVINSGWELGNVSGGTQRLIVGEELGAFYGLKRAGIAQFDDFAEFQGLTEQERIDTYNANPTATYTYVDGYDGGLPIETGRERPGEQLYEDVNGSGLISEDDRKIIGYAQPDLTFGINNSFSYGNLDFSFFIDSQINRDIAVIQNLSTLSFNGNQGDVVQFDRWTPENPSNIWPRVERNIAVPFSDRFIEDATFVRLQNVNLGYNFPSELTEKLNISSLKLYASITNVAMWTDYTGFSPDVSARGSFARGLGHDNAGYPMARTYRIGISLKF